MVTKAVLSGVTSNDRVLRQRAHFDKLADDLGNVWWGHKTVAGQARLDQRRFLVERWARVGPGALVLEPGAGSGEFSSRLAMTGARVMAVELSPKQARMGKSRLSDLKNLSFAVGDVNKLPYGENVFDAGRDGVGHRFSLRLPRNIRFRHQASFIVMSIGSLSAEPEYSIDGILVSRIICSGSNRLAVKWLCGVSGMSNSRISAAAMRKDWAM